MNNLWYYLGTFIGNLISTIFVYLIVSLVTARLKTKLLLIRLIATTLIITLLLVTLDFYSLGTILSSLISIILIFVADWKIGLWRSEKEIKINNTIKHLAKNWKIPAIVLALLILASIFRWETISTKTENSLTYKYKIDHWNGEVHRDVISLAGYRNEIVKPSAVGSDGLTICWGTIIGFDIIWLLYAVTKKKGEGTRDINLISEAGK